MISRAFVALSLVCAFVSGAAAQSVPSSGAELYRFAMLQAAPGRLPDLVALYRQRAPVVASGGDELPILVRHSQGDRWDLLVIDPVGSFAAHYSRERIARRDAAATASGVSSAAFAKQFYDLVAWHEDVWVEGPPLATLRAYLKDAGLAHLEMLQAFAGRRDELVREREMENVFNVGRGRPATLIFTQVQGAAWDVITLDAWRDWRQYGEAQMIAPAVSDAAAKKAGFPDADAVGVFMRRLISTHHDTLGPLVPLTPQR
jgi:hypothetical protein